MPWKLEIWTLESSSSVQFSRSVMSDSVTPWSAACQASLSITNSQSPPKPMSIESVMPYSHLNLCCPLILLPSIFPSIRVFSNESALSIRWPKYWSFSFNISPYKEDPGLISFRMDWLDLLAVQGTLKGLLQHHPGYSNLSLELTRIATVEDLFSFLIFSLITSKNMEKYSNNYCFDVECVKMANKNHVLYRLL